MKLILAKESLTYLIKILGNRKTKKNKQIA